MLWLQGSWLKAWPGNSVVFLGKKVGLALTLSTQWCEKVADNCLGYLKNLWGGGGGGGG